MNSNTSKASADMCHGGMRRCISWSAIMIGAFFGVGTSFLFNLFGIAIGLTAFTAATPQTLAVGGVIALLIISIFSMGVLGWIAGFIGATRTLCAHDKIDCNYGCIYGFGAWCVALVLSILLVMPATHFITQSVGALNPSLTMEQLGNFPYAKVAMGPTVAVTKTAPVAKAGAASKQANVATVAVNADAKDVLASTTFIAFVMFFIGALTACVAGHCGYRRYVKSEECK